MKLLAFDTATEACSAALLIDDDIRERYEVAPRGHARLLLPMLESLLAEAQLRPNQLDALAFGRGPGSFTGVRIAAGVAQGVAFGAGLPVLPVSTLAALAAAALAETPAGSVLAAIDARMAEIYWAQYRRDSKDLPESVTDEAVAPPTAIEPVQAESWCGIGSGWAAYADNLRAGFQSAPVAVMPQALPRAQQIARLGAAAWTRGEAVSAELAVPVYLRNQVAAKPGSPNASTR